MKSVTKRSLLAGAILALGVSLTSSVVLAQPQKPGPAPVGGGQAKPGQGPAALPQKVKELPGRPAQKGEDQKEYDARIKQEDAAKSAKQKQVDTKTGKPTGPTPPPSSGTTKPKP
jgi:hypothetical protein